MNHAAIDAAVKRLQAAMKTSSVPRKVDTRHVHQPFRRVSRVHQVAGGFSTESQSRQHCNTTDIHAMWTETFRCNEGVVR